MAIIRGVEIEIEAALEKLKASRREEERKIKGWEKQLAEFGNKLKDYVLNDDMPAEGADAAGASNAGADGVAVPEEILADISRLGPKAAEEAFLQVGAWRLRCRGCDLVRA